MPNEEQVHAFQDQVHIDQIRERLWSGREFGRAAIMVGAGFSKNAEKISESVPSFPIWRDLARGMQEALYGTTDQQKDFLRLASEYEIALGRQRLDEYLLTQLQDDKYYPGRLHRLLLSLPWSDVFTTNYDTLLERTLPSIHERNYDCVCTASDIPASTKPRIVKLHGSFPSHRPFIITEEDYRTYPTKFAPFVNTVQQSIMENVFCLIGFSGDDPNFYYWTGWVRDHLGDSTPYIFLCGLLDYSSSQRQLCENRKIRLVDLSPLFPKDDFPDSDLRHSLALEWFLFNLLYGAPPSVLTWPAHPIASAWKPTDGLPAVPPPPKIPAGPGPTWLARQRPDANSLLDICAHWRQNRLEYPGWTVCPKANRGTLWQFTKDYIQPIVRSHSESSPPDDLNMLYELNWRLERTLTVLDDSWADAIAKVVESYNPFPRVLILDMASKDPRKKEWKGLDWPSIQRCWVELALALVRYARENQDEQMFSTWTGRLDSISKKNAEWHARLCCERALFQLTRLETHELAKTLQAWPDCSDLPYYEARRASILAESGDLQKAKGVAEAALSKIRAALRSDSVDYALLSQEGWIMALLRSITLGLGMYQDPEVEQFRSRWEKLQTFRCNPWYELESCGTEIEGHRTPPPAHHREPAFDPGVETVTHHSGADEGPLLSAGFLRMLEDGAMPLGCGFVSSPDGVGAAAETLFPLFPAWSLSVLLRADGTKRLNQFFGRAAIVRLTEDQVGWLYGLCATSLSQALSSSSDSQQHLSDSGITRVVLECMPELLSRLCFRLSAERLQKTFDLACQVYSHPLYRSNFGLYRPVRELFERVLYAMPSSDMMQQMPRLLSLPIPDDNAFHVAHPLEWTEPAVFVSRDDAMPTRPSLDRSDWGPIIGRLVSVVKNGSQFARKAASLRLHALHELSTLSREEKKAFSEALWSRISSESDLPIDTGLLDHAFLTLPQPKTGVAKTRLRSYLLVSGFPCCVGSSKNDAGEGILSFSDGSKLRGRIKEWFGSTYLQRTSAGIKTGHLIDWSSHEAITVLSKIAEWWSNDKVILSRDLFFADPTHELGGMVEVLAQIVIPRLSNAIETDKQAALDLLADMERAGLDVLRVSPISLLLTPSDSDSVANTIRHAVLSADESTVRSSLLAILNWYSFGAKPLPPTDLLEKWVWIVTARRQPSLRPAIQNMTRLVYRMPELLSDDQLHSLCTGLGYLADETELSPPESDQDKDEEYAGIPVEYRPNYRGLSAELAYELHRVLRRRRKQIPEAIKKWRDICRADTLPEVRKAWPL